MNRRRPAGCAGHGASGSARAVVGSGCSTPQLVAARGSSSQVGAGTRKATFVCCMRRYMIFSYLYIYIAAAFRRTNFTRAKLISCKDKLYTNWLPAVVHCTQTLQPWAQCSMYMKCTFSMLQSSHSS